VLIASTPPKKEQVMNRVYKRKVKTNGNTIYRNVTENKQVSKESLSPELLAKLDQLPEGTPVPESAELDENAGDQPEAPAEGEKTMTLELERNILINGKVYPGNKEITVPYDIGVDLKRINKEHTAYENGLVRKHDYSRKAEVRPQDVQDPLSMQL
jgi:hypothetical protein